MSPRVEGPDGTVYDLPDEGEEITVKIDAEVLEIDESEGRAPVLRFSFAPATDRLRGFTYGFYPWEVDTDTDHPEEEGL